MASYTRLGSYLLAHELAADPFGKVHRGLIVNSNGLERHVLVRTFSEDLIEAGLGERLEPANKAASLLAGQRGFGHNYRMEGGRPPHVACDYIAGRSLAQLIEKTKREQIPLGVDHALSVLQGIAQAIVQLHGKGLSHGMLSPHSVWVSFEGATNLLDAPYAAQIQPLLNRTPIASAALQRYRPGTQASPLHQDLYALGAILYELLTLEKAPAGDQIPAALDRATLKAAQDDGPVPPEILVLLKRLLLVARPFESTQAFSSELERVLYDGDYSPTTFNMAFFMHTLFREENEQDTQAMKADQAADFSPFLQEEPTKRGIFETASGKTYTKYVVWGGVLVALIVAGFGYVAWSNVQDRKKIEAELASLQRDFTLKQAELTDLLRQGQAQQAKVSELEEKREKAKTAEERRKIEAELAEAKAKQAQIQEKAQQTQQSVAQIQEKAQQIAQKVTAPTTPPPATPTPQPPAQPAPQPTVTQTTSPAPSAPSGPSAPMNLPSKLPSNLPSAPAATPSPVPPSEAPKTTPTLPNQPTTPSDSGQSSEPGACIQPAPAYAPRVLNKNLIPPHLRNEPVIMKVRVFVDPQGRPLRAQVVEGLRGSGLPYEDAAIQVALNSTFRPATQGGKPISSWIPMTINFGKPK